MRAQRSSGGSRPARTWIAALVLLATVASGPAPAEDPPAPVPDVLPPGITVLDIDTGEAESVLEGGRLVHLVFFATWCPPCRDQLPAIADLRARWEEDGYVSVVVGVPERQDAARLREFAAGTRAASRVVLDSDGSLARALGVEGIPTHVVVDRDGRVLARGTSPADVTRAIESEMRRSG